MFRFMKLTLLFSVVFMLLAGGIAQAMPAEQTSFSALDALLTYYNNINVRNYQGSFSMLANPTQTYANYAAGFANTQEVIPYFGRAQALGAGWTGVPAVLQSRDVYGALSWYYGCFNMSSSYGWRIQSANLHALGGPGNMLDSATLLAYLGINCGISAWSLPTPTYVADDATTSAARNLMTYYYSMINTRQFASAYQTWMYPLPGPQPNSAPALDYRPIYARYAAGYGDTAYVDTYPGSYNYMGAAAGHPYLNGVLPMILIGQHTDGTVYAYRGCYVIGTSSEQVSGWGIVSGTFLLMPGGTSAYPDVAQYLGNCSNLSLKT
jgi:hypothetical protein